MFTCKKETKDELETLLSLCSLLVAELRKAPGVRAWGLRLSASTSPVGAPRKEDNGQW